MKYAQRSTAAIAAATLVGAGGIAAAVTGVADASSTTSSTDASAAVAGSQRNALSQALSELADSGKRLDAQLLQARRDLAQQTRQLRRERALSRVPLTFPASARGTSAPDAYPPQSGSTSSGSSEGSDAPSPSTGPVPPPPTHTSTGASGGAGGGGESDDDGSEDDGSNAPGEETDD